MPDSTRDHYLHIARIADHEPEKYPVDMPDWDWPDAPHPEVNDIITTHMARGWLGTCLVIIAGSVAYLAAQVNW